MTFGDIIEVPFYMRSISIGHPSARHSLIHTLTNSLIHLGALFPFSLKTPDPRLSLQMRSISTSHPFTNSLTYLLTH